MTSIELSNILTKFIGVETTLNLMNDMNVIPSFHERGKCDILESRIREHYSTPTITLKDFLEYDLSDDACEGCTITQKAVDNYTDGQLNMFRKRFNSYGVLSDRHLTLNRGEGNDMAIKDIRLVVRIEEIFEETLNKV